MNESLQNQKPTAAGTATVGGSPGMPHTLSLWKNNGAAVAMFLPPIQLEHAVPWFLQEGVDHLLVLLPQLVSDVEHENGVRSSALLTPDK